MLWCYAGWGNHVGGEHSGVGTVGCWYLRDTATRRPVSTSAVTARKVHAATPEASPRRTSSECLMGEPSNQGPQTTLKSAGSIDVETPIHGRHQTTIWSSRIEHRGCPENSRRTAFDSKNEARYWVSGHLCNWPPRQHPPFPESSSAVAQLPTVCLVRAKKNGHQHNCHCNRKS
jgi:hypothetical protein